MASSGIALVGLSGNRLVQGITGGPLFQLAPVPHYCIPGARAHPPASALATFPARIQTLSSQGGNFPVFEGTSLYSLRLDHNLNNNNRLTLRVNASPSTVTGIEVSGQDQPFGQNAYSRTSQQTYRDVAGVVQDTWTIGNSKVNEFRFQYARRGLTYFYNTQIPAAPTQPSTSPASLISDASPTPTFNASKNATSSPTIFPGASDGTPPSSAAISTISRLQPPSL